MFKRNFSEEKVIPRVSLSGYDMRTKTLNMLENEKIPYPQDIDEIDFQTSNIETGW